MLFTLLYVLNPSIEQSEFPTELTTTAIKALHKEGDGTIPVLQYFSCLSFPNSKYYLYIPTYT